VNQFHFPSGERDVLPRAEKNETQGRKEGKARKVVGKWMKIIDLGLFHTFIIKGTFFYD
jgi:hypothetical protein